MTRVRDDPPAGWLFLTPDSLPEAWADRARPAVFVPLLPDETAYLLGGDSIAPALSARDEQIARLTARGRTTDAIARELGVSARTVARRLAHLRGQFGAGSSTELALLLSARGMGVSGAVPRAVAGSPGEVANVDVSLSQ